MFESVPPTGKHTVILEVDQGLHYVVTHRVYEYGDSSVTKETAIARAAAKVSKDLRLSQPEDLKFRSYSWESTGPQTQEDPRLS